MNEKDKEKLSYCLVYKGEEECPKEYLNFPSTTPKEEIWAAEEMVTMAYRLSEDDRQKEFYDMVLAHISKWDPYDYLEVWKVYYDLLPDNYKKRINITPL